MELPHLQSFTLHLGGRGREVFCILTSTIGNPAISFPSLVTVHLTTRIDWPRGSIEQYPSSTSTKLQELDLALSPEDRFPRLANVVLQEHVYEARYPDEDLWVCPESVVNEIRRATIQEELPHLSARAIVGKAERTVEWVDGRPGAIVIERRVRWPVA